LHKHLESDSGKVLRGIVDPYSYRKILAQPKLIIIGTNDHYWPLDALNFYWSDLVGEKHILYVPNNRHGLNDLVRLAGSLKAFHQSATNGHSLPKLSWDFEEGNATFWLRVKSDQKPQQVRVWIASSKTRDFRQSKWTSKRAETKDGGFVHAQPFPDSGYTAVFGEAVYESDGVPYFLSTNVKIVKSPSLSAE
jgi:PhoPQ-activated pathogenicity-related protein